MLDSCFRHTRPHINHWKSCRVKSTDTIDLLIIKYADYHAEEIRRIFVDADLYQQTRAPSIINSFRNSLLSTFCYNTSGKFDYESICFSSQKQVKVKHPFFTFYNVCTFVSSLMCVIPHGSLWNMLMTLDATRPQDCLGIKSRGASQYKDAVLPV